MVANTTVPTTKKKRVKLTYRWDFTPNGQITHKPCYACDEMMRIEHGEDYLGRQMHRTHCPECGNDLAVVAYDCPFCPPRLDEQPIPTLAGAQP